MNRHSGNEAAFENEKADSSSFFFAHSSCARGGKKQSGVSRGPRIRHRQFPYGKRGDAAAGARGVWHVRQSQCREGQRRAPAFALYGGLPRLRVADWLGQGSGHLKIISGGHGTLRQRPFVVSE